MSHAHLTPKQDLALAREALARGDRPHAARHLAGALASDPVNPEFLEVAEALLRAVPENAVQLIPLSADKQWFGDVALHAWLLARTGNSTHAMRLLLQVAMVKPEVPYLAWAREWLASPDFARDVDPLPVAEVALQLLQRVDLSVHAPLTATLREVLARIRAVHGNSAILMMVAARLARTTGNFQESLDIALAYEREHPDAMAAIMAAGAYRSLGNLPAAMAAFHRALERDPRNFSVWIDIGDVLWDDGRPREALEAYAKVLAHEPEHPWALPSTLLLKAQIVGDPGMLRDFTRYAEAHPGNARAQQLQQLLRAWTSTPPSRNEPWVDVLPKPTEATLSVIAQLHGLVARKGKDALPKNPRVTLSHPEPPSALLAAQLELNRFTEGVTLGFTVQGIPEPDPRASWGRGSGVSALLGFRKARPVLWRYQGTDALPAVEPPPAEVADRVAALAVTPFSMKTWREKASTLARELAHVEPLKLAAVMVHPPLLSRDVPAWTWLIAVQMAAALVLAETSAGRTLLVDLLHGPVDWVVKAAVVALTEHALAHPTEAEALQKELKALLERRPTQGAWCLEYPLAVMMPRLPGLSADLVGTLKAWRERLESR
ncbi:tetratricopeptide repeat protein [Corallococcus sp. 4LFB]|uniref:tetratricopeptide repeat protein n=1 Tax=Corallococcus sp. 4LFB TaxID=3383249 RepID=UPI0039757DB8